MDNIIRNHQKKRQSRYWIILPESYLKKVAFLCAYFKCNNSLLLRASTCVMIDELLEEIVGSKQEVDAMLAKIEKPSHKNLEKRLLQKASIRSGILTREHQIKQAISSHEVVMPTGKPRGRPRKEVVDDG